MIPRLGEPVRSDRRYRLRPGVYAILPRGGDVLLTYQAEPEHEVQLPGGGIDTGEQVLPALHREVFEETGWTIAGPKRVGAFRRFAYMPDYDLWAEKVCHVYVARPVQRISAPTEPEHTAIWAPFEAAPGLIQNEGDRMFLLRVLSRL
ncbi:NUDIX domain-containing protein [Alphaproteobacteria bacterium GH1-50]|uniref:NUDIX domain-containing protein n=1 Tax=Kangsaoukella pontilimi TaxID=2691042 RepID=A0A7C9IGV9_9RHOB|nr:NUDIX hydrolase [Kangsaoukella pontilimi]MXQ08267.1 NUDIX domain-containing protein [Kangsaoukella pontilimi]